MMKHQTSKNFTFQDLPAPFFTYARLKYFIFFQLVLIVIDLLIIELFMESWAKGRNDWFCLLNICLVSEEEAYPLPGSSLT